MQSFYKQQGIGLLAAIAIALVAAAAASFFSSWYASNKIMHANRCTSDLLKMQADEQLYQQSKLSGSPDAAICEKINNAIKQYNKTCGADFGTFTLKKCP